MNFDHWKFGHIIYPGLILQVNREVFKKTDKEKAQLATMKAANKAERVAEFGEKANKFLNCSARSIGSTVRHCW